MKDEGGPERMGKKNRGCRRIIEDSGGERGLEN